MITARRPRTLAALAVAALAVVALARPAAADDVLTAAVFPADPMAAILVGPSGQIYEPDGQGAWIRKAAGGLAADVHGATVAGDLVVVGRSAPPYHRDGGTWHALRLGERGRTFAGAGPRAALALGGQIFVWSQSQWKRVGKVATPVTALWAASDTKVFVAAAGKVWRLASKRFVEAGTADVVVFAGAGPWALTRDGQLHDVAARKAAPILVGGAPLAAVVLAADPAGTLWVLGTLAQQPAMARRQGTTWEAVPAPALAAGDAAVGLGVAADGVAVVPTRAGTVWLRAADGTWRLGRREDQLAAPRPGPGPARLP